MAPRRIGRFDFTGLWLGGIAACLLGCQGGVSSSPRALPPTVAAPAPSAQPTLASSASTHTAQVRVTVVVPAQTTSAHGRGAAYISSGTQSVAVIITPPGGTPGRPVLIACSAGTCAGTVGAPAGNDTVTVKLYDQLVGAGNILSTGTTSVSVAAGSTSNVNLTFNPIVATYAFVASGSFSAGTPGTATVTAVAYDVDGNTIVGPGSYVDSSGNPLTITLTGLNETGGNTTMSLSGNTTFTGPSSSSATVTYNGNSSYGATFAGKSSPARGMIAGTPLAVGGYSVTEYSTPSGFGPWDLTVGPDGNMWFTECNGVAVCKVARLTTSGAFSEYAIAAVPSDVAPGPDGRVWFCEQGGGKIGRINTDGTGYVEFAAAGGAVPEALIAGPDGNLWFIDSGNNSIGVMSTSGVLLHNYTAGITAGALGSTWGEHHEIIVGPDNNLWFAEDNNGSVGRITTSGAVSEFSDAMGGNALAIGPDGNIWEPSDDFGTAVSLFNTAGILVHKYAYASNGILSTAVLADIATGNDGNLWISDWANGVIYRMSTSNTVTIFSNGISGGVNINGVIVGPDGNIWFAEYGAPKVGRLVY